MSTPFLAAAGAIAGLLLSLSAQATGKDELLRFQVYLNDKPIGEHTYRIDRDGDTKHVSSRAAFDVDFLFINAYRYRHRSNETFRGDCLERILASTDDNGERYSISGSATGDGFRLSRDEATERADGCIATFAYWDPELLQRGRLLNPQTGELEPVKVRRQGPERFSLGDREVQAIRYALDTDELSIDLWYNDDLGWVGLASDVGKGRRLIYRRI
ncbi:MAG: DUF6134 family protein [Thiohalocapsa sp.]|nr:DUF6134 family protein [Thiohalocapsa sp.]MCF7989244.1 DUF6134 family protein [Thiohalocapsa sp.]